MARQNKSKKAQKPATTLDLQAEDVTDKRQASTKAEASTDRSSPTEPDLDAQAIIEGAKPSPRTKPHSEAPEQNTKGDQSGDKAKAGSPSPSKADKQAQAPKADHSDKTKSDKASSSSKESSDKQKDQAVPVVTAASAKTSSQGAEEDRDNVTEASGFGTVFLMTTSALIGGFAALALQFALETANMLPFGVARQAQDLQQSLSVLRSDFVRFRDQVSASNESSAGADKNAGAIDRAALDAFQTRLQLLENDLQTGQLEEQDLASSDDVMQIKTRLSDLESRLNTMADQGNTAQSSSEAAALNQDLMQRLQALQTGLANAASQSDVSALAARLNTLQQQLADIEAAPQAVAQNTQISTLALTLAGLEKAAREGVPYQTYLAMLKKSELSTLEPPALIQDYAAGGIPTSAQLQQDFQPVAKALLQSKNAEGSSFFERLTHSASSIIIVRPTASQGQEGQDLKSQISRIDNALSKGRVEQALQEWQSIDTQNQDKAGRFARDLEARVQMEQWLTNLSKKILNDLSPNG